MMPSAPLHALALLALWMILPLSAQAQEITCMAAPDEITGLAVPQYSQATVWKALQGEKGMEEFSDIIRLEDGSLLLGGTYTKDPDDTVHKPFTLRMAVRGKVLWQNLEEAKTSQSIDYLVLDQDQESFAALGARKDELTISRYSVEGKKLGSFDLSEEGGKLTPSGIITVPDGYLVAARYSNEGDAKFGIVYKVTHSGKRLWRRAYVPGMKTSVRGMAALDNGEALLVGDVQDDSGRISGWVVRIDRDGAIQWQRTFPRGRAAILSRASALADGSGYVVAGTSWPIGGVNTSGWAMRLDRAGNADWQRFYVGGYHYSGADITPMEDGRILVLVNAEPPLVTADDRYHTRVVTLDPRGVLMDAQSYNDMLGARASRLILSGQGRAYIAGRVQGATPEDASTEIPGYTYDGWVTELASTDPYQDPCLPVPLEVLP